MNEGVLHAVKTGGFGVFVCIGFGTLFAAVMDAEAVPAGLFVSTMVTPSIAIYVWLKYRSNGPRRFFPEAAYLASLIPLSMYFAIMALSESEASDIGGVLLGLYILPALATLAVLTLLFRQRAIEK